MIEQFEIHDFMNGLSLKIEEILNWLNLYFSGNSSLRIISFLLLSLAVILFLLLVVVVYIRHIMSIIKNNNPAKNIRKEDENIGIAGIFGIDDENELEKELQKELELANTEQEKIEKLERELLENQEKERLEKERLEKDKKEKKAKKQKEAEFNIFQEHKSYKDIGVELDWIKGSQSEDVSCHKEDIKSLSLSYKQSSIELNELLGLAIDMLGRGVDELKIAQTLNFKNQGMSDENEILKTIDALKNFINLSINGKFAKLKGYNELPNEDQALYHLANGDSSLALTLLENLMDTNIDKANNSASEEKRQKLYNEVSSYACCFGSLAELNDIMLATSSYELAIELQSTNVTAWGRLGDVYKKASSMPKAIWAYQNVLNFADAEIDINQIANANKNISEHLYAEGNSLQAAKLYNSSKQYYDSLGINRRLDRKEIEIIDIIESNQASSLPEMIRKLLSRERTI